MSRIKTETVSLTERLAEELSKTGIPFRVDAWKNEAPNSYGVVELTGQNGGEWADGRMIDQAFTAEVTLYVAGNSAKWIDAIQSKLEELDAGYSLPERRWLPDIKKTAWVWRATFYGPMEWTEFVEA